MDNVDKKNNKTIMFSLIGIAVMIVAVVGVSLAFFNYTRTGTANNIGTGRIYFNMTQDGKLNLTNVFPVKSTEVNIGSLASVTVNVYGDTTYQDGEEFVVTLTNVNNTINGKQIPIKYIATYTANTDATIGDSSDTYWTSRNSKDANIYTLTTTGEVQENAQVLVGYIKNGEEGINGLLTIKAYIDGDKVAISDTLENGDIEVPGYDNGTTSTWVNGRTILTTEEWNSFQASGTPISFKIKAESNEGIWVPEPDNSTPASCFTTELIKVYKHNTNMTNEEVNTCVSHLTNIWGPEEEGMTVDTGETYEAFCRGTGTIDGITFQGWLDNNWFQQEDLTYFEENNIIIFERNGASITGYDESCGSEVIIPSNIDVTLGNEIIKNAPVMAIGYQAFYNKGLTSITIPDSIAAIERSAFGNNIITQIVVPDTLYDKNESTICIKEDTFANVGVEVKNKSNTKSCVIKSMTNVG